MYYLSTTIMYLFIIAFVRLDIIFEIRNTLIKANLLKSQTLTKMFFDIRKWRLKHFLS